MLEEIADLLRLVSVPGGWQIFLEGEKVESMLVVIAGHLRVSRTRPDGELALFDEIGSGESLGEAALVLRETWTTDVTAMRDSAIAVLDRAGFEQLLQRHPLEINGAFTRAIHDKFHHLSQAGRRRRAESIAVVPLDPTVPVAPLCRALRSELARRGCAFHIPPTLDEDVEDVLSTERLGVLEEKFEFLIFETSLARHAALHQAARQADHVVFVARANALPTVQPIEHELAQDADFPLKRRHLVVLHPGGVERAECRASWGSGRQVERVYPVREHCLADVARLGRFLTGKAVGLVLSGGGARGFAHLGVIKAFEEAGVPIDIVGGNSMGALLGAQYACGLSLQAIKERTLEFVRGGEYPTLPLVSVLSGRRMARDLEKLFGDLQIDELWCPFFAAACNLTSATTEVLETGPLWRAVLASNSPAGLLPPVPDHGNLLVDGAILDNLPVDAMRTHLGTPLEKRHGNGSIIAVDVDVQERMGVAPDMVRLSAWARLKGYLSHRSAATPGIGDILYRAGHIGGLHQHEHTVAMSDVYLAPPTTHYPMMAYDRAEEIMVSGYDYALSEVGQWKHLTQEH